MVKVVFHDHYSFVDSVLLQIIAELCPLINVKFAGDTCVLTANYLQLSTKKHKETILHFITRRHNQSNLPKTQRKQSPKYHDTTILSSCDTNWTWDLHTKCFTKFVRQEGQGYCVRWEGHAGKNYRKLVIVVCQQAALQQWHPSMWRRRWRYFKTLRSLIWHERWRLLVFVSDQKHQHHHLWWFRLRCHWTTH